jgi:hypothetical protein
MNGIPPAFVDVDRADQVAEARVREAPQDEDDDEEDDDEKEDQDDEEDGNTDGYSE